jgi:predicted ferric reductase
MESSHPAGTITIDEVDPLVFIAGGIGITPYRSMIKWAFDRKFKTPMTLIYCNSDENFIFKKELEIWRKDLPNLTIHYINTGTKGRLNKDTLKKLLPTSAARQRQASLIYYIAGSPAFVDAFEKMLLDLRIDKLNIRTDRYDGY